VGRDCNAHSESRGLGGREGTINDDAILHPTTKYRSLCSVRWGKLIRTKFFPKKKKGVRRNEAFACLLTDSRNRWGGQALKGGSFGLASQEQQAQRRHSHGFNVTGLVTSRSHPRTTGSSIVQVHILHFLPTGKRGGRDEEEGKGEGKGKIDGRDT